MLLCKAGGPSWGPSFWNPWKSLNWQIARMKKRKQTCARSIGFFFYLEICQLGKATFANRIILFTPRRSYNSCLEGDFKQKIPAGSSCRWPSEFDNFIYDWSHLLKLSIDDLQYSHSHTQKSLKALTSAWLSFELGQVPWPRCLASPLTFLFLVSFSVPLKR